MLFLDRAKEPIHQRPENSPLSLPRLLHPETGRADRLVRLTVAEREQHPDELIDGDENVQDATFQLGTPVRISSLRPSAIKLNASR